jgi:hypothetical protein
LFPRGADICSFLEESGVRFEIWKDEGNGASLVAVKT